MRELPAPGAAATPRGLFAVLRTWLQAEPAETAPASSSVLAGSSAAGSARRSVRVLVVDDNPVNLMLMSALLESRGLVPLVAADGAEAVALAGELPFDLILMDIQMPILDGLGATMAIRRFEAANSRPATPVIAYSSACPAAEILARHGLNGRLGKPCGDQELEDCLLKWCPAYRTGPA